MSAIAEIWLEAVSQNLISMWTGCYLVNTLSIHLFQSYLCIFPFTKSRYYFKECFFQRIPVLYKGLKSTAQLHSSGSFDQQILDTQE